MVAVVIPVRNGGDVFRESLAALAVQSLKPARVLVLDSRSTDGSIDIARDSGCEIIDVPPGTFNHGGTRSLGLQAVADEIVVYLTHDAVLADPEALERIVEAFADPQVGAAYGRQLPHLGANPLATHARLRNYPDKPYVAAMGSTEPRGIRKVFNSNSFAAYRREALDQVGGFPSDVILGEDVVAAGRLMKANWKIAYVPGARAYHSHNYTLIEEFRRSFDIGVFHQDESWLLTDFGTAEGEGVAFALGQVKWLRREATPGWMLRSIATSASRYVAYRLGRSYRRLPMSVVRRLSMHSAYFADPDLRRQGTTEPS